MMNTLRLWWWRVVVAVRWSARHWMPLAAAALVVALGSLERWPALWCTLFLLAAVGWMNAALALQGARADLLDAQARREHAEREVVVERTRAQIAIDRAFARGRVSGLGEGRREERERQAAELDGYEPRPVGPEPIPAPRWPRKLGAPKLEG